MEKRSSLLCEAAFSQSVKALQWFPENLITEKHCDTLIAEYEKDNCLDILLLTYIPEKLKTQRVYQIIIKKIVENNSFYLLNKFPSSYLYVITPFIWEHLEKSQYVNVTAKNLPSLLSVVNTFAAPNLKEKAMNIIKEIMVKIAGDQDFDQSDFFSWISVPELDKAFKLYLLNLVNNPPCKDHLQLQRENADNLINLSHPLNFQVDNKALHELRRLCQQAPLYKMPEQSKGEHMERFINQELAKKAVFKEIPSPGFNKESTICQGRTLIINGNNRTTYYKLQRFGEDQSLLFREYLIHRYLAEGKATELVLKSEIPLARYLFKLPYNSIPKYMLSQIEPVTISSEHNHFYIYGYCYETSTTDYGTYAWTPDPMSPQNPYDRAVTGMLLASHDLGRWCAMGLLHTSTLPAFHDTKTQRRWLAVNSLFWYWCNNTDMPLCGTFGAWNTTATERPDFRFSGLADLVDYESFGDLKNYFSYFSENPILRHFSPASQRVAFANYIIEVLLGNILLYARLHQQSQDYHIDNSQAKTNLSSFISLLTDQFLQGLMGENRLTLSKALCMSSKDHQRWLERTTNEILYWTTTNSNTRNFATDYQKKGSVDSALYPLPPVYIDGIENKRYPQEFTNCMGKLNLGAENATSPLMSLIQGLTKLSSTIIYTLSQGSSSASEQA